MTEIELFASRASLMAGKLDQRSGGKANDDAIGVRALETEH